MLLKLFGRRGEEDTLFGTKAAKVRDLGIRISLITRVFAASMMMVPALATALVYGVGGHLAVSGALTVGTVLALATLLLRLLGPLQGLSNVRIDVMTALVSFERVFEVLDLPSLVQEKPDAVDRAGRRLAARLRRRRLHLPAGRRHLARLPGVRRPHRVPALGTGAQRHLVRGRAGPDGRAGRPLRRRQDDDHQPRGPALRRDLGRGARRRPRRPRRHPAVPRGLRRLRHAGRPHVPRHDAGQPALRPPRRRRGAGVGGAARGADRAAGPQPARRPRHRRRRPRLPALRRRAAAARDRPPAAQGAPDRGARRGHRPPRQRVRGRRAARPRRGARGPDLAGHRAPALDGARRRHHPGARRRPDRAVRHPRRAAAQGGLYADLYRTQFIQDVPVG